MWKMKDCERSAEEWATIAECITAYVNIENYPDTEIILAMLGIEKTKPDTDVET